MVQVGLKERLWQPFPFYIYNTISIFFQEIGVKDTPLAQFA